MQGNIVISLGFFEQSEGVEITKEQAELFEKIHIEKINMADEIFVIDVNGYIGNSTRKEIEYAAISLCEKYLTDLPFRSKSHLKAERYISKEAD